MSTTFVVIGGGPAGYKAALEAARLGLEVTLIEEKALGGTCLNEGCIPTKSLLAAAEAKHTADHLASFGLSCEEQDVRYEEVLKRKNAVVQTLQKGIERELKDAGVNIINGHGRLKDSHTVLVDHLDGTQKEVHADKILLASGSKSALPALFSFDGERVVDSRTFLSQATLPASLLIIGGGVIGCELAQMAARLGSKVTVVEAKKQILPGEDSDTAKLLARSLKREGIKLLTGKRFESVEKKPSGIQACVSGKTIDAEQMLVAIGRRPLTEGLGLDNAGIILSPNGFIPVNEAYQTNLSHIYAAGDLIDTPMLAHVAENEGIMAARHAAELSDELSYKAVPRIVYTDPEIAGVGFTERKAEQEGRTVLKGEVQMRPNGRAQATGKLEGRIKLLFDTKERLIGASIVGANASEMISMLSLAVELGLKREELARVIYPHPSFSEGIRNALENVQEQ